MNRPKPFVLIIVDGMGVAPPGPGNAITMANTPNLDAFWPKYPHCYLHASGSAVGLPSGTNGNSEVGHMNIGAGKVIFQNLPRIDNAINNGTFFQNEVLLQAISHARSRKSRVHLMGCMSNGNVHSSIDHAMAILRTCQQQGLTGNQVLIHPFTDGRDTSPKSAATYLEQIESEAQRLNVGIIADLVGRYYAMDRDRRWERVAMAYNMLTKGSGKQFKHWKEALEDAYNNNITDQYIDPRVIVDATGNPVGTINQGDSVIFFNFRPDRAIQLSVAFTENEFDDWKRSSEMPIIPDLFFCGMTEYEKGIPKVQVLPPEDISLPIGRIISEAGMRQLRITESEKFAHVTYFVNGGNENPYQAEDRIEIPSIKEVATYDQKPEMSTYEVTDRLIQEIHKQMYDFIIVNYANVDMVGHTGNLEASIKAVEIADDALGKLVSTILHYNGACVITADHGNTEEMINLQTGKVDTEHSTNPVPFLFISNDAQPRELSLGILADIAPTILAAIGINKPGTMTGRNLLL